MAYLVRRLLENTSNESFLHAQAAGRAARRAARRPAPSGHRHEAVQQRAHPRAAACARARPARRRAGRRSTPAARCACRSGSATSGATATRSSPPTRATPDRVVARAAAASAAEVDHALGTAPGRPAAGAGARAAERAAGPGGRRRSGCASAGCELAALEVRECAKPWPEADARRVRGDRLPRVLRAAAVALEHSAGVPGSLALELIQLPGERNELRYAPRGVVAVISPWNFPLAIPLGMTAAGLATGNAVVLKPAEQAPGCALRSSRRCARPGVPADALALLPGEGDVGAALVARPARAHDRVHRLQTRSGWRSSGAAAEMRARPEAPQARRRRDGRQELRDRRLRRRPRRGRPRAGQVRVQLRRPEVLGGRPRAGPRGGARRADRAPRGRDRGARRRPGVGPRRSTSRR